MTRLTAPRRRSHRIPVGDDGVTTAEYAVGTKVDWSHTIGVAGGRDHG